MAGPPLTAIVVGGGIGGLTAALSLLRAGLQVQVYEQAAELAEVGAGLQLSPNATRVLQHLGLGPALSRTAVLPEALESRHWQDGRLLGSYRVNGSPPQYGAPHYLVYRPHLLDVLVSALPADTIRLGWQAAGLVQDPGCATVEFTGGRRATADLVVAADGIHSALRAVLFGADQPVFSGTVAYRGLLPADRVRHLRIPNTSTKWWGPRPEHHLVHYHLAHGDLVNVVGVVPEDWRMESWVAEGTTADLAAAFRDFHAPVPELTAAAERVYKFAIFDRPPLPEWTAGRVTLLGDACHPMVPFMAQGAAMAVEDAAILGRCLQECAASGVASALRRYSAVRRQRTGRMQAGSRADTSATWGGRDWVYGFDPLTAPLAGS
jgi:salicylate hydroxylase